MKSCLSLAFSCKRSHISGVAFVITIRSKLRLDKEISTSVVASLVCKLIILKINVRNYQKAIVIYMKVQKNKQFEFLFNKLYLFCIFLTSQSSKKNFIRVDSKLPEMLGYKKIN